MKKRRLETGHPGAEVRRLIPFWEQAVDLGLMASGTDVNYRTTLNGDVLSDAIGAGGRLLVDGRELTPAWAAELRRTKPALAPLIDHFERTGETEMLPPGEYGVFTFPH
ncbi:hypothetical protein ACWCQZ_49590 [Streptomyces sp. NPDC002285]